MNEGGGGDEEADSHAGKGDDEDKVDDEGEEGEEDEEDEA
jgi:hypothetical protein